MSRLSAVIAHTKDTYFKDAGIFLIFSLPLIFALLIPIFVPAPTYIALGGIYLRTGSIPELSKVDIVITIFAYMLSMFIIADTITNINLIIKSKRTKTKIPGEVLKGMGRYATKIFLVYIIILLLLFLLQIATYDMPQQNMIFSIAAFILFLATFFVSPAIVIDDFSTMHALGSSLKMIVKKWDLVAVWILIGLISITVMESVLFAVIPMPFSTYLVMLANALFILPFLVIFQTHIYMEKYPLTR